MKGTEPRKGLWLRTRPPGVLSMCRHLPLPSKESGRSGVPTEATPLPRATPLTAAVKPLQFALVTSQPAGSP